MCLPPPHPLSSSWVGWVGLIQSVVTGSLMHTSMRTVPSVPQFGTFPCPPCSLPLVRFPCFPCPIPYPLWPHIVWTQVVIMLPPCIIAWRHVWQQNKLQDWRLLIVLHSFVLVGGWTRTRSRHALHAAFLCLISSFLQTRQTGRLELYRAA